MHLLLVFKIDRNLIISIILEKRIIMNDKEIYGRIRKNNEDKRRYIGSIHTLRILNLL